jgi:hypothetical protein
VAPAAPVPVQTAPAPPPARQSSRIPVLTAKGESYKKRLTADQACLAHQREIRTAKTKGVPPPDTPSDDLTVARIVTVAPDPVASSPVPTVVVDKVIVPDKEEIGFLQVVVNLIVTEASCLSVRSDICHNPLSPDYNMQVPPTTYDEAMCQSDSDNWLVAMHKEINLMSEMNVYELVPLPTDKRAIGCQWVLEFKEDLKGGPAFKARLVAQGFSQVQVLILAKPLHLWPNLHPSESFQHMQLRMIGNWIVSMPAARSSGENYKKMSSCVNPQDSNVLDRMGNILWHTSYHLYTD